MTKISIENQINELNKLIINNKLDIATVKAEKLIKQYPNSYVLYNALGVIELKRNNLDDSIMKFTKATNLNPNYTDGFINLGIIYEHKNNQMLQSQK